ncbi:protein kinase [Propioniciclava soli]|uniref:non-specific serine/threonine protein kinase n=1 Tax=Propioniciclava soli TaxID=2775081 RepID=A0ABZ3C7K9_9ACTN
MREGDVVGDRYRLGAPLGRGAMGQVFRAHDDRLDRDVAVKVVDLSAATDPDVADRFHREAIATARLNHPNIVTIFDADTEGQTAFLVMELLPGRPLSQVIRENGPLPLADAIRIAGEVARALVATHRIGVVHRDIKPANIMMDARSVKLLDFGIAQISLDASAALTRPATTLGTAAYMSPEQARGERATAASDVYALGGVLMAMLTGQPAFPGDHAVAVLHRQINDPVPWVRQRRPDVPATVDDLVHRMLAKNPEARPHTTEVVTALQHLARNLPDPRRPAPPAPPTAVASRPIDAPGVTAVMPADAAARASAPPPPWQAPPPSQPSMQQASRAGGGQSMAPLPGQRSPARRSPLGRAAVWLVVIIVALLVLAVVWALGTSVFGVATPANPPSPTPAASSTTEPMPASPTTSAPAPTSVPTLIPVPLPSISLPSVTLPSVNEAALSAALQGVDAALTSIDASRSDGARDAQADLREQWADVTANSDDHAATVAAVSDFRESLGEYTEEGDVTAVESQLIGVAVGLVEAALG